MLIDYKNWTKFVNKKQQNELNGLDFNQLL